MRLKGRKLFNVDRKSVVKRLLNIDSNLVNASVSKSVANFVEVINSYIRPNLERNLKLYFVVLFIKY